MPPCPSGPGSWPGAWSEDAPSCRRAQADPVAWKNSTRPGSRPKNRWAVRKSRVAVSVAELVMIASGTGRRAAVNGHQLAEQQLEERCLRDGADCEQALGSVEPQSRALPAGDEIAAVSGPGRLHRAAGRLPEATDWSRLAAAGTRRDGAGPCRAPPAHGGLVTAVPHDALHRCRCGQSSTSSWEISDSPRRSIEFVPTRRARAPARPRRIAFGKTAGQGVDGGGGCHGRSLSREPKTTRAGRAAGTRRRSLRR